MSTNNVIDERLLAQLSQIEQATKALPDIGTWLQSALDAKGMTLTGAMQAGSGMSKSQLHYIVKGSRESLQMDTIRKLARFFNVPPTLIFLMLLKD